MNRWVSAAAVLLMFGLSLLVGCSGGGGGSASPSAASASSGGTVSAEGVTAGSATIYGLAHIGREPLDGARITVVAQGQELPLVEPAAVGQGGAMAVRLAAVPSGSFELRVTTARGEVFCTQVDALSDTPFVHTNVLTTLCATYRAMHPSLSISEVRARIHAFVSMRLRAELGDEIAHVRLSNFSQELFLARARAWPGGLAAYLQQVAQAVDLGSSAEYVYTPDSSFANSVQPLLDQVADKTVLPPSTVLSDSDEAFAGGVGGSLVDPAIRIVTGLIGAAFHHRTLTQFRTTLADIQTALVEVNNAIGALSTEITYLTTQAEYYTLIAGITQNDIPPILTTSQNVENVAQYAESQDLTNLGGALASLYGTAQAPVTIAGQYNNAVAIFQTQLATDGIAQPALTLGWTLCNLNAYLNSGAGTAPNLTPFESTVHYYVGYQIQAASNIAALASPYDFGPYPNQTPTFGTAAGNSPAAAMNDADNRTAWTQTSTVAIPDMVAQQLCFVPYPLLGDSTIYDIANKNLWYCASTSTVPDTSIPWVQSLNTGGISRWFLASESQILALFKMASSLPGNPPKPSSYTALLNKIGFTLTPGKVTATPTTGGGIVYTCTSKGFLTVTSPSKYSGSFGYDIGWIDDAGNHGYIGSCVNGDYNVLLQMLDSPRGLFNCTNSTYLGKVTGPMLVAFNPSQFVFEAPSFAYVTMGAYSSLKVTAQAPVADPLSNGSSFTQQLVATADGSPYLVQGQSAVTHEVYWATQSPASASQFAPISNVVPAPSPTPTPADVAFTPLPNGAGTIHWLPGSAGQTVTFVAARYTPSGTRVTGTIQLTSPVTAPFSAALPDAVDVWPSCYTVASADLATTGVKLWFSRHWGKGNFDNVTNSSDIVVTASDPSIVFNASLGKVTSTTPIASGTTVTVTVTDTRGPAGATPSDTCTLYVK
jgi:hypothetical protein